MMTMTKQAPFYCELPEGVKAALLRLKSACQRDGVDSIRVDFHDDSLSAWVRGKSTDALRYVVLIKRDFYEMREVDE